jgi:cytochrome c2
MARRGPSFKKERNSSLFSLSLTRQQKKKAFQGKKVFVSCLRRQVIKYNDKVGPEILSLTRRQSQSIAKKEGKNLTMRAIVTEKK